MNDAMRVTEFLKLLAAMSAEDKKWLIAELKRLIAEQEKKTA
ncbi:hypothetical protein [Mesorhizobium silamurunense]|nr:hypothetical protein [Mesorhizobium silamurunense]